MQSSKEQSQNVGPLGDRAAPAKQTTEEPEEKWLPVDGHPGYVKSTKTGAIKHKDS